MSHTRERGVKRRQRTRGKRSEKIPSKKAVGCGGENKLMMAQQAQEAAYTL